VDADGVGNPEGSTGVTAKARSRRSTGVKEQGTFAEGLPRNLGGPVVFTLKPVSGTSRPTPGRRASRPMPAGANQGRGVIPHREGRPERLRDGRRGVGAPE
jgi:hypothetical protein